jgi:hypothetical protein
MKTVSCKILPFLVLCLFLTGPGIAEETQKSSDEQVKELIAKLGAEAFAERQAAEEALAKVGAPAIALLEAAAKDSPDPQVRLSAQKLAATLRWNTVGAIKDFLKLFPEKSVAIAKFTGGNEAWVKFQKTVLGQIVMGQITADLRKAVLAAMPQKEKDEALKWTARFSGQIAGALWDLDPDWNPNANTPPCKGAAVIEITAEKPNEVWTEIVEQLPPGDIRVSQYKGLTIIRAAEESIPLCAALAGRYVIIGITEESLKYVTDKFLDFTARGFADAAEFAKLHKQIGEESDLLVAYDFREYMKFIATVMKAQGGPAKAEELFDKLFSDIGMGNFEWVAVSSKWTPTGGEDRVVMTYSGELQGAMALQKKVPPGAIAEAVKSIPAEAAAATAYWLEGQALADVGLQTAKLVFEHANELQKTIALNLGQEAPVLPTFEEQLKKFETMAGMTIKDVSGLINGPSAFWLTLAPPGIPMPPEIAGFIGSPSPESANKLSDFIAKVLQESAGIPNLVQKDVSEGKTIYSLNLANVAPQTPYTIGWTVVGNKIYMVAASKMTTAHPATALKKYYASMEPGLTGNAAFKKISADLQSEALNSGVFFVDAAKLMALGTDMGKMFLPFVMGGAPPEMQPILQEILKLPAGNELYKDVPAVLVFAQTKDGAITTTLRGPVPVYPTFFGMAVGAAVTMPYLMMQRMMR